MPTTAEDKANFGYEHTESRVDEAKNDINTIRTHAKWQLGLLAALTLGLASFVFTDLGKLPVIYEDVNETAQFIKLFAGFLLIFYSVLIALFIPLLLWGVKVSDSKDKNFTALSKKEETKKLEGRLEEYTEKLYVIDKRFKRLIISSISSPLVAAVLATYFTYLV